jgi:hypothetical protein
MSNPLHSPHTTMVLKSEVLSGKTWIYIYIYIFFKSLKILFPREAHWTCKLYMPQYRGTPGPKRGSGWAGEWGWVDMGDFWYSIGNVNELNT